MAFFTLYSGKRQGKEREGKLMAHSESSYLVMGSNLYSISLPTPSLIHCCFCSSTDRSVIEKCHSVSGEILGIIGQNQSDSTSNQLHVVICQFFFINRRCIS